MGLLSARLLSVRSLYTARRHHRSHRRWRLLAPVHWKRQRAERRQQISRGRFRPMEHDYYSCFRSAGGKVRGWHITENYFFVFFIAFLSRSICSNIPQRNNCFSCVLHSPGFLHENQMTFHTLFTQLHFWRKLAICKYLTPFLAQDRETSLVARSSDWWPWRATLGLGHRFDLHRPQVSRLLFRLRPLHRKWNWQQMRVQRWLLR